jgi:hypothetical protein
MFVDACDTPAHQAILREFPILVAISAKPLPAVVVVFIGEANRDAVVGKGPQFFDQPVIKLARPLAGEKGLYSYAAGEKLRPISPLAIRGVRKRDLRGISRIPAILGERAFSIAACSINGGMGGRGICVLLGWNSCHL